MASNPNYHDLRPEVRAMAADVRKHSRINAADYVKYDVKRGLRDLNGKGVVAGLTEISEVHAKEKLPDGTEVPCLLPGGGCGGVGDRKPPGEPLRF